ncbi:hypothetical protein [Duganella sp. FT27W]|uniref:hypothetical protein n=1 Tax=Duganella sp. FT27W TaxID=2654636 RepID=UPI00128CE887|nr:hypothetical protein [Duganella sp. FT27W]MPQ57484.1 hypothetical protein [Duganella sp. FT27W]
MNKNSHDNSQKNGLPPLFAEAAVSETFRPKELLEKWLERFPNADEREQVQAIGAALELQTLSKPMEDGGGDDAFGLPNDLRLELLAKLGARRALSVLKTFSPRKMTRIESDFQTLLEDRAASVDSQNREALTSILNANRWALAVGIHSPYSEEELLQDLKKLDFLQNLGGADLNRFVGRASELGRLHKLFNGLADHRITARIEGPGGIGKSLLVCRFIADLLIPEPLNEHIVPNAVFHIDFDRVAFHQARLITILHEFLLQSGFWHANQDSDEFNDLLESARRATNGVASGSDKLLSESRGLERYITRGLVALFNTNPRPPRIVVFVDSYEQVLGFDDTAAGACSRAIDLLEEAGAVVMIIYASRTFFGETFSPVEPHIKLVGLTAPEADTYLRTRVELLGLKVSSSVLSEVRQSVGNTPLALRLAASLIEHDPSDRMVREWGHVAEQSPELIQAALYDRLLRRVRNEQLKKVAIPGLLLRRITPDIIEQVLASACGLDLTVTTPAQLIAAAKKEGQLFDEKNNDPGALWHRQDVRLTMLNNLDRSIDSATFRAVNEQAVAYYVRQQGRLARVEELYHRLRLNQDTQILESRWVDGAETELRRVRNEFSAQAQAFLRIRAGSAHRASITAFSNTVASVDLAYTDNDLKEFRISANKQLQAEEDIPGLIARLDDIGMNLNGALGDIYAQGLFLAGRHRDLLNGARRLLHKRAASTAEVRCEIFMVAAQLLEGRHEWQESRQFWTSARSASKKSHDELSQLRCTIAILRISRKLRLGGGDRMATVKVALDLLAKNLSSVYERAVLSREICAELLGLKRGFHFVHRPQDSVERLMAQLVTRGDLFPSAVEHRYRLARINELLNIPLDSSIRNLRNLVSKLSNEKPASPALIEAIRDEIDWNLAKSIDISESQNPYHRI